MKKIKISCIQLDSLCLEVDKNIEKAIFYIRKSVDEGAKIICLPEIFDIGYNLTKLDEMLDLVEKRKEKTLEVIQKLAKELEVYIIVPIIIKSNSGKFKNTAFIINEEGEIVLEYSKTHILRSEENYFERGKEYPVIETPYGKIGVMICNDMSFPEVARILAINGAEIIFVPSAWQGHSYLIEWWNRCLAARALDNQLFIAATNRSGISTSSFYGGNSQILNPRGDIIKKLGIGEEVLICEIDLDEIKIERDYNTSFYDRRIEDYKILSEK